jgi:hypothetical protein
MSRLGVNRVNLNQNSERLPLGRMMPHASFLRISPKQVALYKGIYSRREWVSPSAKNKP